MNSRSIQVQATASDESFPDVSDHLIDAAFDVILEGYIRVGEKSPDRFHFEQTQVEELQLIKERLIKKYQSMAIQKKLDRMALLRHMRFDLRERLCHQSP